MGGVRSEQRWQAHPWLARLLMALIVVTPIAVSTGATVLIRQSVDVHSHRIVSFVILVAVALLIALVVERGMRRFLPLATLLRLTMLFPDRAPSRFKIARSAASSRRLRDRLSEVTDESAQSSSHKALTLITALGNHDRHTRGHSERVRLFADMLGDQMRLPEADRDRLRWAALLHDVGKLQIDTAILNKPSRLDASEFDRIKSHPQRGVDIVGPLMGWLGEWGLGIPEHHERWDGDGYPAGLTSREISQSGRMLCVVDAFETMTAARAYKKAMATRAAREELARCAGTQFDPECVRQFLAISLPKLMLAMGPLSFLTQLPFLRSLAQAGSKTTLAGVQSASAAAAGVAGVAAAGVIAGPAPHPALATAAVPHAIQVAAPQTSPLPVAPPRRPAPVHRVPTPVFTLPPAPPVPAPPSAPTGPVAAPPSPTPTDPAPTQPTPTQPTPTDPSPTPTDPAPVTPSPTPTAPSSPAPSSPDQPAAASAAPGDGTATVSWSPPTSDGGSPITGYTITPYDGSTALASTPAGPSQTAATITGLTDGTAYTFQIVATNASGSSAPATTSAVTPTAAATAPSSPTSAGANAGDSQATVTWSAPTSDGGSPITGYTITPYNGSTALASTPAGPSQTAATITGLTDGTAYTFQIVATNNIGSSAPATTGAVTPANAPTAPGSPTAASATAGNAQATVTWSAPSSDGGSAITGYTVTPYTGSTALASQTVTSGTTATIQGLTNGTAYTFQIVATNAVGSSTPTTTSAVTPAAATAPGSPASASATAGDSQATVSWTPPTSTGGSPITHYVITPHYASSTMSSVTTDASAGSVTITGLRDGVSYTFDVVAQNAVGSSVATTTAAVTPSAASDAPSNVVATAGTQSATVSWTSPSIGTVYGYYVNIYTATGTLVGQQYSYGTATQITGLTTGQSYYFTVETVLYGVDSAPSNTVTVS